MDFAGLITERPETVVAPGRSADMGFASEGRAAGIMPLGGRRDREAPIERSRLRKVTIER
jgi:hypothetical protein